MKIFIVTAVVDVGWPAGRTISERVAFRTTEEAAAHEDKLRNSAGLEVESIDIQEIELEVKDGTHEHRFECRDCGEAIHGKT